MKSKENKPGSGELSSNEFDAKQQPSHDAELKSLDSYRRSSYSQFGEDGIVAEILRRLGAQMSLDMWCAEFGAWDGVYLSNTCRLIRESGYNAVLIEGDPERVEELTRNFPQSHVRKICRFVDFEGANTLDAIFSGTEIPRFFDFLSIDVDGVDYHIFDSLKLYAPKVVCIEFNPTIPNAVDFVQAKDFKVKQGSSAKAIARLAREKGYALVAATACNLIFVDARYMHLVCPIEATLEDVNPQGNHPQYIFTGYDGTILSNKEEIVLNWHSLPVPISKIQFLPRGLRKFYGDYSNARWIYFALFMVARMPRQIFRYRKEAMDRLLNEVRTRFVTRHH